MSNAHVISQPTNNELVTGHVQRSIGRGSQQTMSSISYVHYPVRDEMPVYQRRINLFISSGISSIWQDQPDRSTENPTREWFAGVLAEFDSMYSATDGLDSERAPWSLIDSTVITDPVTVLGVNSGVVQVFRTHYQFTGGAHGLPTTLSMLFSRTTGDVVSFRAMLGRNYSKFKTIAERCFRQQRGLAPRQSWKQAGYWFSKGFEPSDNVRFVSDSIEMVYNPYEIAPYSYGTILIRIPITEIAPLIQPAFLDTK